MLDKLPVESVLETLSYLPVKTLRNLQLVSKDWRSVVAENESTVYKKAALLHGYILSTNSTVADLVSSNRSLSGLLGWKDICRRRHLIQKAWLGQSASFVRRYTSTGRTVHRIKVDEHAGLVITTSRKGGVIVADMTNNQRYWSLPNSYVRSYAHVEYGNGFLIFDRWDGSKEVWRRTCDCESAQFPTTFPPDILQRFASNSLRSIIPMGIGDFTPWALLRTPLMTRAYRFVYPSLLVAAENSAYVWDIPSATLIQTIQDIGLNDRLSYVELSARHVFIAGTDVLRVFSREDGNCVLDIPPPGVLYANSIFDPNPPGGIAIPSPGVLVPCTLNRQDDVPQSPSSLLDQFVAVHVSACGSHLVALLQKSKLLLLYNFERVIRGEIELSDAMHVIQLGPSCNSRYLAYENDRVAVATIFGIFVLTINLHPDPLQVAPDPPLETDPVRALPGRVSVCLARRFKNQSSLRNLTCLQMTDTGLYFNWAVADHTVVMNEDNFEGWPIGGISHIGNDDSDDELPDPFPERPCTVYCIDFLPSASETQGNDS